MAVVVWIVEDTWRACVTAAREHVAESCRVVLLHVSAPGPEGQGGPQPGPPVAGGASVAARELLAAAAGELGRPCTRSERFGRVEHEVVAAAEGAELLILARDGEQRLGPRSLGPASRYVVDHAPCPVLLVWPEAAPGLGTLPPPPANGGCAPGAGPGAS